MLKRFLAVVAALIVTAIPSLGGTPLHAHVAVLPFAAADTGLPYGLLPSRSELSIMTHQFRAGLGSDGVPLVAQTRVARAVSAADFDQATPIHSCVVVECARKIGRAVHADTVIYGAVTREMAVVWGTSFFIVDVRSGSVMNMSVGYKGDVEAMELGERDAGTCIARVLRGQKRCPPDPGW